MVPFFAVSALLAVTTGLGSGPAYAQESPPRGSYSDTCNGVVVKAGVLYAQCRTKGGAYVSSSTSADCRGEVQNNDACADIRNDSGNLTCS